MFSELPLGWKLIALALFFGVMLLWALVVTKVIDWLPSWAVAHGATAVIAGAIGLIAGDRLARREIKKTWGYDPLSGRPE